VVEGGPPEMAERSRERRPMHHSVSSARPGGKWRTLFGKLLPPPPIILLLAPKRPRSLM
jgi:hypothetical protein